MSVTDQKPIYNSFSFLEYDWCNGKKCLSFVQFIVWEGIPISLPFGTDVVPEGPNKFGDARAPNLGIWIVPDLVETGSFPACITMSLWLLQVKPHRCKQGDPKRLTALEPCPLA